jgi:hypothetical protein
MSTYTIHFGNKSITLRETAGKTGNLYLASRPASEPMNHRFGFNVKLETVTDGALPTKGELRCDGELVAKFNLEQGKNEKGAPKVSNNTAARFTYDGVEQTLAVRISNPRTSVANVLIRTSRKAESRVVEL